MSEEPTAAPDATDTPPDGDKNETVTMDDLREVRAEAKKWRLKLREAEGKNEELTGKLSGFDSMKSTLKKLTGAEPDDNGDMEAAIAAKQAEMDAMRADTKKAYLKSAFIAEAAKMNIANPNLTFKMIDSGDERLSVDLKTGEVDGISEIVTELIKEAPFLVKAADDTTPPPAPAPNITAPGSPPPTGLDKPADKEAQIAAALKKAGETGGMKAVEEFQATKRKILAESQ